METGIKNTLNINTLPNTIFDVGTARGTWSLMAKKIWPNAEFVLFEPLEERKEILNILSVNNPNFHIINKGAGKKNSQVDFFITNDLDGSGIADNGTNAKKLLLKLQASI